MEVATATESTPVSSPEAAPAAPATSAPTSPDATSQRPTSFRDAFEQVAAANPDDPTALESAAAIAQPVDPTNAAIAPEPKQGPIPFDVHKTSLENARTKAVTEAKQQFEQQYPGLSAIDPQTYSGWQQTAREMASDPIGFVQRFVAQLESHHVYGPQLRSHAGKMLASGRGQSDPEPQPDVQIVDQAGNVTGMTFSAKAQAEREAWHGRKMLAQVQQELQPIKAERERAQAEAHAAETARHANAQADTVMGRVDAILDGDTAMYAHMDALMAANPHLDAVDAALQVRKTHIVPTLEQRATQKALDLHKQKAAGTTANGTGVAATPKRPTNRAELAAHLAALNG